MVGSLEGGLMLEKEGKRRVLMTFDPFPTHMISATRQAYVQEIRTR